MNPQKLKEIFKNKKVLIFLGLLILIPLFLFSLSFSSRQRQEKPTPTIPVFPTKTGFPKIKTSSAPKLISSKRISSTLYSNQDLYFSSIENGVVKIYKKSLDDNRETLIIESQIKDAKEISISPDKSSTIIVSYPISSYIRGDLSNLYLNLKTGEKKKFASNILSFSFSPDGKTLAYISFEENKTLLFTSFPDASSPTKIVVFPEGQNQLQFLNQDAIISWAEPDPFVRNIPMYITNLKTGNAQKIQTDTHTFGVLASPNKDFFLSQRVDTTSQPFSPYLVFINPTTLEIKELGVQARLEKVAFDPSGKIIYGISKDSLFDLDLETLKKDFNKLPGGLNESSIDPNSLFISFDKKYIYFTSKGSLFSLSLR